VRIPYLEASWPEWTKSVVRGYAVEDGSFTIPHQPGLGVEVDEQAVERYRWDLVDPSGPEPPWVFGGTRVRRPTDRTTPTEGPPIEGRPQTPARYPSASTVR
jgi:hypothetical protein